jgi:hypothetical protein
VVDTGRPSGRQPDGVSNCIFPLTRCVRSWTCRPAIAAVLSFHTVGHMNTPAKTKTTNTKRVTSRPMWQKVGQDAVHSKGHPRAV